jgi:glycosyltransferase 2 family protein
LLPGVFNFVVAMLTSKIQAIEMYRLPPARFGTLAAGLVTTGFGWWAQGLSMWAMLQAVMPDAPELSLWALAQCTAAIAFATVAGFVVFIPGGLGVRELLLSGLLSSLASRAYVLAAAILLRLTWIVAEAIMTAGMYWWKPVTREDEVPAEPLGKEMIDVKPARQEPRPPEPV